MMTPNKEVLEKERKHVEFEKLSVPLIKYLNDNYHPHTTIIITPCGAEMLSVEMGFGTQEYIKDEL